MDPTGDGRNELTQTGLVCDSCGAQSYPTAKFCSECGTPLKQATRAAEYKQVTVLFADVVHSMDIAAAVGAERLREIMADVADRCAAVVQRYGGTVDKFTGDGVMAVFGAPVALEDHAVRACLASLEIHVETSRVAAEVAQRDGLKLQLRVGLNSGEVVAGDIGSAAATYTAVGQHVGMAQRMESVASPGGVMLSQATARLVEDGTVLGELEMVRVKGASDPVPARRLVAVTRQRRRTGGPKSDLVGRQGELRVLSRMLDDSVRGSGNVACVVGPAGIGKSRLLAETELLAISSGAQAFSTCCESHAAEIPFYAVAALLREAFGIDKLDDENARARLRAQLPGADPDDLILLEDMLGVSDARGAELKDIGPDARRRRVTELVNAASLARSTPALYLIEDVHWIDATSEALLVDFLSVVPQTGSLVLIAYRPEYRGALTRIPNARTIALEPLDNSQTETLIRQLLGPDPTVAAIMGQIAERAAGNPFFAEEIVRDLAHRGLLRGSRGAYKGAGSFSEMEVPATLHAAIASRIDRLEPAVKRILNAAAVIGTRFGGDLLACLTDTTTVPSLIDAELIDQVTLPPRTEYVFRHPLIRAVAYRSQLKSIRAQLHQQLAVAIQQQNPDSLGENAALIAEHLEAAGNLGEAFGWHMRAAEWLSARDLLAARVSWQKACAMADKLAVDDADRMSMQISPLALLCVTAWRAGGTVVDTGFEQLRTLAGTTGDELSLAIGTAGQVIWLMANAKYRESSALASEGVGLMESINDSTLTLGLTYALMPSMFAAGEITELLRLAQRVIDLADGDPNKGNIIGSPLMAGITFRAAARCFLGDPGWKDDVNQIVAMVGQVDLATAALGMLYKCVLEIVTGGVPQDRRSLPVTARILEAAERSGDDYVLAAARCVRGFALMQLDEQRRRDGFELLGQFGEAIVAKRFSAAGAPLVELPSARERARTGDVSEAIEQSRALVESEFETGEMIYRATAVTALVETLLQRGTDADVREAEAAAARLAAVRTDPAFGVYDVALLRIRAVLARAHGDAQAFREFVGRCGAMARSLGYDGHVQWAEAMS